MKRGRQQCADYYRGKMVPLALEHQMLPRLVARSHPTAAGASQKKNLAEQPVANAISNGRVTGASSIAVAGVAGNNRRR